MTFGLFVCSQLAQAASIHVGDIEANRVLFLGNSLTYHPPKDTLDPPWTGNWGMDASTADKDYAHLVTSDIAAVNGGRQPAMHADNIVYYGGWEQNYGPNYNAEIELRTLLDWQPDLLVVELGDNSSGSLTSEAAKTAFANSFGTVLTAFKNHSRPKIFVLSTFWPNATTDGLLRQECTKASGVFVDISDLYGNPLNQGGWGGHPSDAGMAAIADKVFDSMVAHSAPEPGSLVLCGIGLLSLAVYGWRKKSRQTIKT
jgi:lysophospholipase L1-like esterase